MAQWRAWLWIWPESGSATKAEDTLFRVVFDAPKVPGVRLVRPSSSPRLSAVGIAEGDMCGPAMQGFIAQVWSKPLSRTKEQIRTWGI
jgi:hypothetical protein